MKMLDALLNLVANMGTTKDKSAYTSHARRTFAQDDLSVIWREDWLGGKIIDIPVEDMTREWRTFQSSDLKSEQIKELQQSEEDLKVQDSIVEVLTWARLYGGAALVLGIDGAGDMAEPLELESISQGSLKYLLVLDRWDLMPGAVNTTDPSQPDFRIPSTYTISGGRQNIHYSRVIPFYGIKLPWKEKQREQYWGQSIIQRVYDAVINAQSIAQSVNTMAYEAKISVVKVENLFTRLTNKGEETALINRFQTADLMKSTNNMMLIDKDKEEFEQVQQQFAGLSDLILRFLNIAAAAADIPATRLLGESAPGLNSTGIEQTRQYYDMVASQQKTKLKPQLDRLDQVLVRSTLGHFPEDWNMTFNSLWQTTSNEQADIDLKNAQRDQIYVTNSVVPNSAVLENLKENGTYQIENEFLEEMQEIDKSKFLGEIGEEETPIPPMDPEIEEDLEEENPELEEDE